MNLAEIIFAPQVDAAILNLIDHLDPDELQGVLQFLDKIQRQLVSTLSMFLESWTPFTASVRYFPLDGYVSIYEFHSGSNEVHVLDLMMPGQNWR